jgi:hypothetical protein
MQIQRIHFFWRTATRAKQNFGGDAAPRQRKLFFRPRRKSRAQSAICAKLRKIPRALSRRDALKFVPRTSFDAQKFFRSTSFFFFRRPVVATMIHPQTVNPSKQKPGECRVFLPPRSARHQCSSLSINSA